MERKGRHKRRSGHEDRGEVSDREAQVEMAGYNEGRLKGMADKKKMEEWTQNRETWKRSCEAPPFCIG